MDWLLYDRDLCHEKVKGSMEYRTEHDVQILPLFEQRSDLYETLKLAKIK